MTHFEDQREDYFVQLLPKGFFLEKVTRPITLDTDPKDGFEFIHKSRLEDACLDFGPKKEIVNVSPTEENCKQTSSSDLIIWGREQTLQFSHLAHKLKNNRKSLMQKFPRTMEFPDLDEKDWCTFCLGSNMCADIFGEDLPNFVVEGHQPLLSIVLHLDRNQLMQLICWHYKWFKAVHMTIDIGSIDRMIDSIAMWTYALCCNLHKPLGSIYEKQLEELHDSYKEALDSLEDCSRNRVYLIVAILKHYFGVKYYKHATAWNIYTNTSYFCPTSSSSSETSD
ncbi:hypothetical protein JTE90_028154 [Oedothorax gibbosus]|uniref:Uncharacterized protein n=1 Tax=Oedothorax gibbosus TaxID=931172 RepID=A0AAV6V987_9ARAC|nr:hypothetical protein JTE90_028154 [Oedothorax gibbosus]